MASPVGATEASCPAASKSLPTVDGHNSEVQDIAKKLGETFDLPAPIAEALVLAAAHHDDGKKAQRWQIAAGHTPGTERRWPKALSTGASSMGTVMKRASYRLQ